VKIAPEDSDGRYAVFHLEAPPMSGPPLHVHTREDKKQTHAHKKKSDVYFFECFLGLTCFYKIYSFLFDL
jgi:hypothetical protein